MGLRNVIVKDRDFKDEDLKKIRENSIGLSTRDVQAITAVTPDLEAYSARKRVKTFQIFSFKGKSDDSNVIGVTPSYFRLARYDLSEAADLRNGPEGLRTILRDRLARQTKALRRRVAPRQDHQDRQNVVHGGRRARRQQPD